MLTSTIIERIIESFYEFWCKRKKKYVRTGYRQVFNYKKK